MKKFLLLICATLLVGQFMTAFAQRPIVRTSGPCGATEADKVTWEYNKFLKVLSINGNGTVVSNEDPAKIPWKHFLGEIRDVRVNDTVDVISSYTFRDMPSLTTVKLNRFLKKIDRHAFSNCPKLETFTLPESVETVYLNAFTDTKWYADQPVGEVYKDGVYFGLNTPLTSDYNLDIKEGTRVIANGATTKDARHYLSVTLPSTLEVLCDSAFAGAIYTDNIMLPYGLRSIGKAVFSGCGKITDVVLPATIEQLGDSAFDNMLNVVNIYVLPLVPPTLGTDALADLDIQNRVYMMVPSFLLETYNKTEGWKECAATAIEADAEGNCGDTSVGGEGENLKWYLVKDENLYITGAGRMDDMIEEMTPWDAVLSNIKHVIIDNGVTSIGSYTFGATNMETIEIGSGVTEISNMAFEGSPWYAELSKEGGSIVINDIYYKYEGQVPADSYINIEAGIKSVSPYAFAEQKNRFGVGIPMGITKVADYMFSNSNVNYVGLPMGIKEIGQGAFSNCKELIEIVLPKTVEKIRNYAFRESAVEYFFLYAANPPVIASKTFEGAKPMVFVFDESLEAYKAAELWKNQEIYDMVYGVSSGECGMKVDGIAGSNVEWEYNVKTKTIEFFGNGRMDDYEAGITPWLAIQKRLENVILGEGITYIGNSALANCDSLREVTLPADVEELGSNLFDNCISLTKLTVKAMTPPTVTETTFGVMPEGFTVYVEKDAEKAYKEHSIWGKLTIKVIGADLPVGTESVKEEEVHCYMTNGTLMIDTEGEYVLYNVNGAMIHRGEGRAQLTGLPRGIYIVKLNGDTQKISL